MSGPEPIRDAVVENFNSTRRNVTELTAESS